MQKPRSGAFAQRENTLEVLIVLSCSTKERQTATNAVDCLYYTALRFM